MARIQLRNTKVFIEDGLAGTAAVNEPVTPPAINDTNFDVDTVSLNTAVNDQIPVGARFINATVEHTVTARTPASGPTTNITFTPALTTTLANDVTITFISQRLEIKIGEGDISWTESRGFIYDLDRDRLDTVRQDVEVPLAVDSSFTYEYIKSQTGRPITPVEALKGTGAASEWVSSSSDLCEPYAVNLRVRHLVPCGTDQDEDVVFPDFRYETLEFSIADASVSVAGQCNSTEALATRGNFG
jgi:hypothetical protein